MPHNKSRKNLKEVWHGLDDDIVVVVMGQIGVGKSTFVHHLLLAVDLDTSVKRPAIGDELESCTIDLEPFVIPSPNGKNRLVIVDTPGFDDTFATDFEIMRCITKWLASSYSNDMMLGGVIYLHDMSQPRLPDTTLKNFEKSEVLCAAKTIVLGMTKSEELLRDVREKREKQLHNKLEIIKRGARMERFEKTSASAWKILYLILGCRIDEQLPVELHPLILQIQKELIEQKKSFPSTLEEVLQMQNNPVKALKSQSGNQTEWKSDLIERLARLISKLSDPESVWQRVKNFFASKVVA